MLTLRLFVRLLTPFFKLIFVLGFAIVPYVAYNQERCGTVEYMKKLQGENFHKNGLQFEQWIERRGRASKPSKLERQQAANQIPVVVHVIHNGEAVGSGKNISDAQILSQISVLNKDYQRLNSDAANTPAEFQSVAGSFDVEFVLAKQDPEGLATNGIVRVQGTQPSWTINDNYAFKSLSYWPAEDYLNIWVCDLSGLLGYAQFPVSNLSGLENSSDNRLTDGIVIAYNAFGSEDDGAFNLLNKYKKGRTTTHEVGHFFGLRHIWGDDEGQCSGTDYVADTPNQGGSSSGCPSHPQTTCSVTSMFQNFLDYTDDACMNLFTMGQVERMTTVLENSPRRASLTSSHGLLDPQPVANDLGIKSVISPLPGECTTIITPIIEVKNYGNNVISSAQIRLKRDGVTIETIDFNFAPGLSALQAATVSFSATAVSSGSHTVTFDILLTNTVADINASNNTLNQSFLIPETIAVPFTENFNTVPSSWQILNPDLKITWQLSSAPNANSSNTAMKMDFYNYEDNLGEIDLLITPVFDLSDETLAILLFDVAYARFQDDNDGLKIFVLSNCNTDITQGTLVYDKFGTTLQTVSATTSEFIPSNATHWRNEFIDLSAFAGQSNLQLAFVGINDWGNNLYLDNISLVTTPLNDIALKEVTSPRPVLCSNQIVPKLRIQNVGTFTSSFKVKVTLNEQSPLIQSYVGLNFASATEMEIELSPLTLSDGENTISFELQEPNGVPDVNTTNNALTAYAVVNDASDQIPVRQNFEQPFEGQWTAINPTGGMNWEMKSLSSNQALYFNAFDNTIIGDKAWFVSPVLDFSATTEASLSFDLSYASNGDAMDQLQVLVSTDCGNSYTDTLLDETRSTLSNGRTATTPWVPSNEDDWRNRSLNLSQLAGESEVRVAFVFTSRNGNNIYIDNIEFFTSENPVIIENSISVYPIPVRGGIDEPLFVTFNLPEKGPVLIDIIDPIGKILISQTEQNVLNQTYEIFLPDASSGVYIVRAKTSAGTFARRVIFIK